MPFSTFRNVWFKSFKLHLKFFNFCELEIGEIRLANQEPFWRPGLPPVSIFPFHALKKVSHNRLRSTWQSKFENISVGIVERLEWKVNFNEALSYQSYVMKRTEIGERNDNIKCSNFKSKAETISSTISEVLKLIWLNYLQHRGQCTWHQETGTYEKFLLFLASYCHFVSVKIHHFSSLCRFVYFLAYTIPICIPHLLPSASIFFSPTSFELF